MDTEERSKDLTLLRSKTFAYKLQKQNYEPCYGKKFTSALVSETILLI